MMYLIPFLIFTIINVIHNMIIRKPTWSIIEGSSTWVFNVCYGLGQSCEYKCIIPG